MTEAFDPVKHYFLEYIDPKTGKMRDDAPKQAKKDFRRWQNTPMPISDEDIKRWNDELKKV